MCQANIIFISVTLKRYFSEEKAKAQRLSDLLKVMKLASVGMKIQVSLTPEPTCFILYFIMPLYFSYMLGYLKMTASFPFFVGAVLKPNMGFCGQDGPNNFLNNLF